MHRDPIASNRPPALKIAIISAHTATMESLRALAHEWDASSRIATVCGGVEQAARVAEQERPDVLLIEGVRHDEEELMALGPLTLRYRNMAVILLSPNQSPAFLRHGMRIGLREMLPLPVTREMLFEALGRVQHWSAPAASPEHKARILSLIGCKGGAGTTFLAANLGYALAEHEHRRVALIDLNRQFGDASFYVSDQVPGSNLADVTRQLHRLDGSLLESSMVRVLPNYHVLAAPEEPEQALHVRPEHIDALLWTAASHYDVVVLDAGRSIDDVTVRALDQSETVLPVLQLSLPFVRDAKRLIRALAALGYSGEKVRLLVNRFDKGAAITVEDVAAALKREVFKTIPNGFSAVAASIDQGVPILKLAPGDAVAKALRQIAGALAPHRTRKPSGWLKALLPTSMARAATLL